MELVIIGGAAVLLVLASAPMRWPPKFRPYRGPQEVTVDEAQRAHLEAFFIPDPTDDEEEQL